MRTLITTAFVSLDGVVEAPGGEPGYRNSGWTFKDIPFDEAAYELKGREQDESTAMLMGRVSYEAFSPVWPGMTVEFAGYNGCRSSSSPPPSRTATWCRTGVTSPSCARSTTSPHSSRPTAARSASTAARP